MDDLREWISDNLRYMMLGGGILLIVLVIVFGVRACTGSKDNDQGEIIEEEQQTTESEEEVIANPLTEADESVTALMRNYYQALSDKDTEALKTVVVNLSSEDEEKVATEQSIDGYQVGSVYTKSGLQDGEYVVYTKLNVIYTGQSTAVPGLSNVYVVTDTDGQLKVQGNSESNREIQNLIASLASDTDYTELAAEVETDYQNTISSDENLRTFLDSLGQESTDEPAAETQSSNANTYVATTYVNIRSSSYSDGEDNIIGQLAEGETVVSTGTEDGWILFDYNGQTGYVYGEYMSPVTADTAGASEDTAAEEEYIYDESSEA